MYSCDEMQFFKKNKKNTLEEQLLTVFTDITCSEISLMSRKSR